MSCGPEPTLEPTPAWKYLRGLAPTLLAWGVLVAVLAVTLYARTRWWQESDDANLREWLNESRIFRDTLSEAVRDYLAAVENYRRTRADVRAELTATGAPAEELERLTDGHRAVQIEKEKLDDEADEVADQLRAMADPVRAYTGQLPLFLDVYRLEVRFGDPELPPVVWQSSAPVPRSRGGSEAGVRELTQPLFGKGDRRAKVVCQYRMHTAGRVKDVEAEQQRTTPVVMGLVVLAGALAVVWVYRFLRRERHRDRKQLLALQQVEHAEKLLLEEQLRAREAEREKEELDRRLLEQSLEAARMETRAAAAEGAALEMKSQLYASIGIMAGSYAHNIKNLLVRPNDLLSRCLEADGLSPDQESMLGEVRQTLGTVTERLQQILRTVRRDPSRSEMTRIDLNELVRDVERTWVDMAREKWKLALSAEPSPGPLWVDGDLSHLQQAAENLLFNARDATFEMRNHLREAARRKVGDPAGRKQGLIEAAGWKGRVTFRATRQGDRPVLEVRDNGVGMTEAVRQRCTQTHFSTKRDNALYEGYSAGMGLGLSFVVVILEHHGATLEVESEPQKGALFRVVFPAAKGAATAPVGSDGQGAE
jgi:signal transduction histidine kinase